MSINVPWLWLIPFLLLMLVLFRVFPKGKYLFSLITVIVIVLLIKIKLPEKIVAAPKEQLVHPVCPTSISPEDFEEMISKDIDGKGGVLAGKHFKPKSEKVNKNNIEYNFTKETNASNEVLITEIATIESNQPNLITYKTDDRKLFLGFFSYLDSIGIDSIKGYYCKPWDLRNTHYPAFRYKDCLLLIQNYTLESKYFNINVYKYDTVQIKKENQKIENKVNLEKREKEDKARVPFGLFKK